MTNKEKLEEVFSVYDGIKFGCQSGEEVIITTAANRSATRQQSFCLDDWLNEEYREEKKDILQPCPFCGGKAVLHVKNGVRAMCKDCGTGTISLVDGESQGKPTSGAVRSVIEKWNKRAGEQP